MQYKISYILKQILQKEKLSGILLMICTIISLIISNLPFGDSYRTFWDYHFSLLNKTEFSIVEIINELLMSVFFLFAGLEIKRELIIGELSTFKKASLPIVVAIGGMIIPAIIYCIFNFGQNTINGWGIPMATDIAFALGFLLLAGKEVPSSLRIILVSLAVVDDIGAIVVIALFYTHSLSFKYLLLIAVCFSLLLLFNKKRINNLFLYIFIGCILWWCVLQSGVHSTIAGVLLAITIPYQTKNKSLLLSSLIDKLQTPVFLIILPLFALANSCIEFRTFTFSSLSDSISVGIIAGLIFGKPLGICTALWIAVKTKISVLPPKISHFNLIGLGFLGGVGFTMSIFVSLLAFPENVNYVNQAKTAIILASLISGVLGVLFLRVSSR